MAVIQLIEGASCYGSNYHNNIALVQYDQCYYSTCTRTRVLAKIEDRLRWKASLRAVTEVSCQATFQAELPTVAILTACVSTSRPRPSSVASGAICLLRFRLVRYVFELWIRSPAKRNPRGHNERSPLRKKLLSVAY